MTADQAGRVNQAYYFDGTGHYIDCGNGSSLQISGDITVCAWVKLAPTSHGQVLVNKYHLSANAGWLLEANSNGFVCFDGRPGPNGEMSNSGYSSQSIFDNQWHFLTGQRQHTTWKIFVDGVQVSAAEGSSENISNSVNMMIGVQSDRPTDGAAFCKGVIDEVRIYNCALSDADIQQLFESGTPVELTSFSAETGAGVVTLNWTTHSETENYGFHVYRSQVQDGNYQQISRTIIPGAGNSSQALHYTFIDREVSIGQTYYYKLADIDYSGHIKLHGPISVTIKAQPKDYTLKQNYPNPFNPTTTIVFAIAVPGHVSLKIYNMQGELVRTLIDAPKDAGEYAVSWNGRNDYGQQVASGSYIYLLKSGQFEQQRKMLFTK